MEEFFDVLDDNGEYTGKVASREECHKKGYWHRAVYGFIINKNGEVLLQKRSASKKLWPNKWDVTVGGHVDSGEFGRESLIRETKEELGIDISDNEIKFLLCTTSDNLIGDINNKHFNEGYIITKNIDIKDIKLQESEVSDIKFFPIDEVLNRIKNNYEGLTEKTGVWNAFQRIVENYLRK